MATTVPIRVSTETDAALQTRSRGCDTTVPRTLVVGTPQDIDVGEPGSLIRAAAWACAHASEFAEAFPNEEPRIETGLI